MDVGAPSSSRSGLVDIEISDIRITGIETCALERDPNCYLAITPHNVSLPAMPTHTRPVRSSAPRWPETLRFTVEESSLVTLRLMRKRRIGSDVCIGGYQLSVQEVLDLDRNTDTSDIGLSPLTQVPDCANPRGSIALRIAYEKSRSPSTLLSSTRPQINQIQNDAIQLASSSSALATSASAISGITLSADSSAPALALASCLLRTSTALDKFVHAMSAISEIHPAAKLSMSLVTSAYDAWKGQTIRDARVVELATTIADLWEFMTQEECLEKVESLKKTVADMVSQTSECAKFIREYTLDTRQVVRLAKNTLSDKDAIVSSFEESFTKLKDNFRAGIDVKVVIVVLDMQQKLSDIQTTLGSLVSNVSKLQVTNPVPGHASTSKAIVARSAPQIFNGRDEYVANIVQTLLISDQARVPILGPGGMGKTSVALAVANDATIVQRFEDRRHFVPCEEVTNPAPLVELIALHLGVVLPASNPFQHLLASLYTQFSPCLVVLDNFETPWDSLTTRTETEEIIAQLSSVPTLSLIITMRGETPPFGIDWSYPSSQLLPLPLDAAKATFLKICPSDDEKLEELLTALDCVPLAVTLIAYVGRSSRLSASELLASWKSEQTKLLDLGSPDRLRSVDHSIRLSLESTTMKSSPVALQLLSIVAMLPGGAVLRTLPSLVPSIANLDRATRTLLSVSLAYKGTGGTLRLLSPIRSYIAQHHTPDSISLESLRTFYYKLADQCEGSPGDKDFLRIQDEVALEESNMESVLLNCLSELSDDDAVRAVNNYSWYLYWNHPRFELLEAAINVAQQGNFTELLPQCLQRLGYILISQGEYTRAFTALEEARGLFCVGKNQLEAALCLERHAEILRMQSQNDEARAKLEEVRKEFQAIGNQKGTARCLQCLGDILRMQERYVEARSALEDARELLQELGEPLGAAQCLRSIGLIHFSEEQYSDARTILEDAQNQFQAIGETSGATQCLHYLGDVLLEQGQYEKARVSLEKAREQYQEMGERAGSVECLVSLGEILRREARYDEALSYLDEAYSQFRAIGNRLGIANSLIQIARNCVALDRNSEALKALEEARELYLEIGAFRSMKNCDYLLSSIRVGD